MYVLGAFGAGGLESVVSNIHENINHTRFKIDFVLFNGLDHSRKSDLEKYDSKIYYINRSGEGVIKNINEIKSILEKGKYEIVHAHTNETSLLTALAGKLAKTPVVICHSHNTVFDRNNKLLPFIRLGLNTLPDRLFACSNDAGKKLFGENSDFLIIKNAIDSEKYLYNRSIRDKVRKDLGVENSFVIGNVGRLNYQKNHKFLLLVFKEILKKRNDAVLVLVGEGELEVEIKQQIKELNIQNNVLLLGSRNDVANILQAMDIFLFPSLFEGLGVSLIEAQCSGLPCIVSEQVPKEVAITNLVKYISLNETAVIWAETVLSHFEGSNRGDTKNYVIEAGYDIKNSTLKLEKVYLELLKGKRANFYVK